MNDSAAVKMKARRPKEIEPWKRLSDVVCPQCRTPFRLIWNDYADFQQTLDIRDCPSGGVYDVTIRCPHCDYREEL